MPRLGSTSVADAMRRRTVGRRRVIASRASDLGRHRVAIVTRKKSPRRLASSDGGDDARLDDGDDDAVDDDDAKAVRDGDAGARCDDVDAGESERGEGEDAGEV